MVSLQMHGEEFLHLKRVGPGLLTAFARTVEANSPALGTGDDIVVADDVLLKVVFALEAVLATIPKASQSHAFMLEPLGVGLKKL